MPSPLSKILGMPLIVNCNFILYLMSAKAIFVLLNYCEDHIETFRVFV